MDDQMQTTTNFHIVQGEKQIGYRVYGDLFIPTLLNFKFRPAIVDF